MEVCRDAHVYDTGMVTIIEMHGPSRRLADRRCRSGRRQGLTVPTSFTCPRRDFDMDAFLADVKAHLQRERSNCIVAVSEGIHYADGTFVSEAKTSATDGFGHAQLGGLAARLADVGEGRRPAPRSAASS